MKSGPLCDHDAVAVIPPVGPRKYSRGPPHFRGIDLLKCGKILRQSFIKSCNRVCTRQISMPSVKIIRMAADLHYPARSEEAALIPAQARIVAAYEPARVSRRRAPMPAESRG